MSPPVSPAAARDLVAALPGVRARRMFGAEGWFVGTVLFAFVAEEGVVVRLPDGRRESAIATGVARPWIGALPAGVSGWVVLLGDGESGSLLRLAHSTAQALSRRRVRRPATRRRRSSRN